MAEEQKTISIETLYKRFQEHLSPDENKNIIFTGKYGIGKTFFLKKYFENTHEKFNAFFISPVNYVVSSNEDIFQLIKADIIKELFIGKFIEFKGKTDFNNFDYFSQYALNKPENFLDLLFGLFSQLSVETKIAKSGWDAIKEFKKNFDLYKKKLKKADTPDEKALETFAQRTFDKQGGYLESNLISSLIYDILKTIEKKNVLVLDDLDRLDPEHIFRILNILSAHNNENYSENKFGFDKIIIVCDIENIEKIYKHKYGGDVDFDGYMDKFYSIDYFRFTNSEAVVNYVENSIEVDLSKEGKALLIELISCFANGSGGLNLRKLLKHKFFEKIVVKSFTVRQYNLREFKSDLYRQYQVQHLRDTNKPIFIKSDDVELFKIAKLLSMQLGDYQILIKILNNLLNDVSFNYVLGTEKSSEILKPIVLFHNATLPNKFKTFFTEIDYGNQTASFEFPTGQYSVKDVKKTTSTSIDYKIALKWTAGSKYDSEQSFYEGASLFFIGKQHTEVRPFNVTSHQILSEVLRATEYLVNNHSEYLI